MKLVTRALVLLALAATVVLAPPPTAASGIPAWAPAATAPIHPGVQTVTEGGQCTANFVFYEGTTVYIGQAAHCSSLGAATDTNGCLSQSLPLGTPVDVGGVATGTLVYNSWLTMQAIGETDGNTCLYNDLALVELSAQDAALVNPSIPFWGGPIGIGGPTASGAPVYSYGNSSLRLGIATLSPKRGVSVGMAGGGWSHSVYTASPGIPGDSGSAFLDGAGRAIGVLSTLAVLPLPLSNGVGDIAHELAYLNANTSFEVTLATGTEPFNPNRL